MSVEFKRLGRDCFLNAWRAAGLNRLAAEGWHQRLITEYAEEGRAYHNLQHLSECLEEFDDVRHLANDDAALDLALWFHDAVYDARAADNEEQSSQLAQQGLEESGNASAGLVERVRALIMSTKTHEVEPGTDAALMVDVDLSILGKPWVRFQEYNAAIRSEYSWVPAEVYETKRREVLEKFLSRGRIFHTPLIHDRYEASARSNLRRVLDQPSIAA